MRRYNKLYIQAHTFSLFRFGKNITCDNETEATASDQLYLFILLGLVICGIGSTPVQPLGFSYIDDHAPKHNAAVYIGM